MNAHRVEAQRWFPFDSPSTSSGQGSGQATSADGPGGGAYLAIVATLCSGLLSQPTSGGEGIESGIVQPGSAGCTGSCSAVTGAPVRGARSSFRQCLG